MRTTARFLIVLLVTLLPLSLSAQAAATLELVGENGVSKTLTMTQLAALRQVEVVSEQDGVKLVFRGPALRELITMVGAPTGQALRGSASMMLAVIAEAGDGYKVGYMVADIDPQFGARNAILALTQDGKPLPERDGPLRVIMPGEEHHARWIRQVNRLRLTRIN